MSKEKVLHFFKYHIVCSWTVHIRLLHGRCVLLQSSAGLWPLLSTRKDSCGLTVHHILHLVIIFPLWCPVALRGTQPGTLEQ